MSAASPRVLVLHPTATRILAKFAEELPGHRFATSLAEAADAEILFGVPTKEIVAALPRLRWIHYAYSGIPPSIGELLSRRGIVLTNSAGIYDPTVPEHALALLLALARRLDFSIRRQLERRWEKPHGPSMRDLAGGTLAIIGAGSVGRGIARLTSALGMRVLGYDRCVQRLVDFDQQFGPGELLPMCAQAQWLVSAVPWTRDTHGMIGREVFAALPEGARFINVSRGGVVDESALIEALKRGRLAGAGLDVTETEPLPADSPLWDLPNVIVTPHCAADPANAGTAAAELFLRNLHNDRAGLPLERRVDLEAGY